MSVGRGRVEQTMDALVEALLRLLDRRSAADVSVRDIAAEAGVNHGLVHHYFGNKEGLIREAMIRTMSRVNVEHPPGHEVSWTYDFFHKWPALVRVVARVCLDGPHDVLALAALPPDMLEARLKDLASGLERRGVQDVDPRILGAMGVAVVLGWILFRPLLEARFGLPEDADERLAHLLQRLDAFFEAETPLG